MVTINVVQRFRRQRDLRSYRRRLIDHLVHDELVHLLPALLDLSLPLADPAGKAHALEAVLHDTPRVTLSGEPGRGRGLALRQLAVRWAAAADAPLPRLLSLPAIDDLRTAPEQAIARAQSTEADAPSEPCALLVHGYEELPPARREAWRTALQRLGSLQPELRCVVVVPIDEPAWEGYTPLAVRPPSPALLVEWVECLAPVPQRAALLAALDPSGPLGCLDGRLLEVALLAWVAPQTGVPATRAALYERALLRLIELQQADASPAAVLAQLQLLAAYDEVPQALVPGLLAPTAAGGVRFVHPLVRAFLAARQLVAERRYDLLQALPQTERAEVARFAVTVAPDPSMLYTQLWGPTRPTADDLFALGRCLRERPQSDPRWALRVVAGLARLAHEGHPPQRARARKMLPQLMPSLDMALDRAAELDETARRFTTRLLGFLPAELGSERAARLAYDQATPEPLAWELADLLVARPPAAMVEPPTAPLARARWAYVQALVAVYRRAVFSTGNPHHLIAPLVQAGAGTTRLLRVGTALLDDVDLPIDARLAGLALLPADQPGGLAALERACYDPALAIRQAALDALAMFDPDHTSTIVSQVAFDRAAPLDTRLNAVVRLCAVSAHVTGGEALLARCAADASLPLFGRLLAAESIDAAGAGHLVALLHACECHPEVRAIAARRLGHLRDQAAFEGLLQLLTAEATPPSLVCALCESIAMFGDLRALGPLLALLERATADVGLTIAAIDALGRLGSEAALPPLVDLLGPGALARLERAAGPCDMQQPALAACEAHLLPAALHERLERALVGGASDADRPTTLAEFLSAEADHLRAASARALASIGGNAARAALLAALIDGNAGNTHDLLIDALIAAAGSDAAAVLAYLVGAAEANPLTRWLAVQRLRALPEGAAVLQQLLAQETIDPFVRGAVAEALGQCDALAALPLLRRIAEDTTCDKHLRLQAILALGLLDDPATEAPLLRLIDALTEDVALRGQAAESLPTRLSTGARQKLRDMLRRERPPVPVVAGVLRALGRAHDRESLPLLLRYVQDDTAAIVQAALLALCDLGDASVAPVLIRVVQNPGVERAIRLQAVGTLLQLGGAGYVPLLRSYLESGPLPLRLQALEHMIAACPPPAELLALLADRDLPVPMRIRVLNHRSDDSSTTPVMLDILRAHDDTELQHIVIATLARRQAIAASATLVTIADDTDAELGLRLRAIEALEVLGGAESYLALSRLAEDLTAPVLVRLQAMSALSCLARRNQHTPVPA